MAEDEVPTYYELIGVSEGATVSEIESGYRRAMKVAHPDDEGTAGQARLLAIARDTLVGPERRRTYDNSLRGGASKATSDGNGRRVPSVLGLELAIAESILKAHGFSIERFRAPAPLKLAGKMLAQDPFGGAVTNSARVDIAVGGWQAVDNGIEIAAEAVGAAGSIAAGAAEANERARVTG